MTVYQYDTESELVKPLEERQGRYKHKVQNPENLGQILESISNEIYQGTIGNVNHHGIPLTEEEERDEVLGGESLYFWCVTDDGNIKIND